MTKKELKHCIYLDALFIHKVITTGVGIINTVLQLIGWVFFIPGYLWYIIAGKIRDNDLYVMIGKNGLLLPVTGTIAWLEQGKVMWTTWDYSE